MTSPATILRSLPTTAVLGLLLASLALPALAQGPRPNPPPQNNPPPAQRQPPRAGALDPGPSGGAVNAGGPLANLSTAESNFFLAAQDSFAETSSVSGALPGEAGVGLGPRFNHNSCVGCHAHPAAGGSSPPINPQVDVATLHGARNVVPSFITRDGPVREVRFVRNADGTPDGGVHNLFVISGRSDAPGCNIVQPDFAAAVAANNVTFRIPTPLYGAGLVEATPDNNLIAAAAAQSSLKASLGIGGHFATSANDGTISRFGWKAQNKSMTIFAGEAYNVEQGVTNELFPNERETAADCQFNAGPEDATELENVANVRSAAAAHSSDAIQFATLFRLSAAPTPAPQTAQTNRGLALFNQVGCQGCHIAAQTTGRSAIPALNNVTYFPFSDFALHDMGRALADGITQGNANGRDWRTAPLWGLGQRLFFLHDGRADDLDQAIAAHSSNGSEANQVIGRFDALSAQDRADLMAFLRSL